MANYGYSYGMASECWPKQNKGNEHGETKMTKIYIYSENCQSKGGRIYRGTDEEAESCGDVFLWSEGTEEELIKEALQKLAKPCNSAPHFRHKCARNVLEFLNGPEVEAHYEAGKGSFWLPVSEDAECN